jgi:hypothetical protein
MKKLIISFALIFIPLNMEAPPVFTQRDFGRWLFEQHWREWAAYPWRTKEQLLNVWLLSERRIGYFPNIQYFDDPETLKFIYIKTKKWKLSTQITGKK